ncbi:hypothetical protein CHUAL_008929 [Chamberlinius hualienensis]
MVVVEIAGFPVDFPFEPYDVQRRYMEKVLECLRMNYNGVLESPTGTGKTLSLLCACLAYLETVKTQLKKLISAENDNKSIQSVVGLQSGPKIIYSMRTHSQVSHAFNEFLRTGYKNMKATVIGSRDQLCLNPEVATESNKSIKINLCKSKVNSSSCHFYNNVESTLALLSNRQMAVDIEDLMKIGNKNQCCPYYLSRHLTREADVVFMPYNYLLDSKSRKYLDINIENNIVIFDEAHNVEQLCETSASCELKSKEIAVAITEVTFIMQRLASISSSKTDEGLTDDIDRNIDFSLDEVCCVKTLLCEVETQLDAIVLAENDGLTLSSDEIYVFFDKAGLNCENRLYMMKLMEKIVNYLSIGANSSMRKGGAIQKFVDMIAVVFQVDKSNQLMLKKHSASYKVYVSKDETKKTNSDVWSFVKQSKQPKVLQLWCFNPGVSMKQLVAESPKCVIFTSGTLAPLDSFVSELQISIPVRLENPHIIQKSQLHAGIICKGPDGVSLNSSFKTRSDLNYVLSLGKTIVNFTRVIPKGVLVFFPSYYLMKECHKHWEENNVWFNLSNLKKIFVESQGQDVSNLIQDYYNENRKDGGKGAIMMAVCRGKVSEGIDFADDFGRCVIVTGLPFRPWKDPKVIGKMDYVSSQLAKKAVSISGRDWYDLEGIRAVNQAVGRVIRHKDDYATILLCDERFAYPKVQNQLSSWLKPFINNYNEFGFALRDTVRFFKPKKETKLVNVVNTVSNPIPKPVINFVKLQEENNPIQCSEEEQWAKNIKQYSTPSLPSTSTNTSSMSLFEALETDQSNKSKTFSSSQDIPLSRPSTPPSYQVKRKKLKVIGPQESYEMAKSNDSSNSKALKPDILLKNLKTLLTADEYKLFSSAIRIYNTERDVLKLGNCVVPLCKSKAALNGLLAFNCLLPESDRLKYKQILLSKKQSLN